MSQKPRHDAIVVVAVPQKVFLASPSDLDSTTTVQRSASRLLQKCGSVLGARRPGTLPPRRHPSLHTRGRIRVTLDEPTRIAHSDNSDREPIRDCTSF